MRVIGAGLFVWLGTFFLVVLIGEQNIFESVHPWLIGIGISLFMFIFMGISMWLFNPKGSNPFGFRSIEDQIRQLKELDLLDSNDFIAVRAFGVDEYDDEGLHYFLELTDGRILFLSGQYLYDFEPISDDPEVNQPRSFPCTEFTVLRHKKEQYVLDIICGGSVLEPEFVAPPFSDKDWKSDLIPEDGQIINDISYEDLKEQRI